MIVEKYLPWVGVFLLFLYGFYQLFKYISKRRSLYDTYEELSKISDERQEKEEQLMKEEGRREKTDFLTKLDILILQSGIKRKLPFLTAEIYIAFAVLVAVICFAVTWKITGVILFSVMGGLAGASVTYIYMEILTNSKAKSIEEDMGVFLDMIAVYSKTSDDIVDIMGKVYPFIHEPLSTYVEEFYFEAINKNAETAFMHLKYKIPHEKMNEILGNLETCSKSLTDYNTIANESQEQITIYLEGKKERANARMDGGMELLSFFVIAVAAFFCMAKFAELSIVDLLINTVGGQCLIAYFSIIAIYGLIITFSYDKG